MTDPALDPKLYYKSEARPISRLLVLYNRCGCGKDFPFEKWLEYRDKARKDLFWLGKTILKKDLTTCHEVPCNGLFVPKDFDGVYHEDYTIGEVHQAIDRQKRIKEMLWLDPRGAFKSTIDGIDCVQWLLNCPDIRILILTGEYKLALAFLSEIKGYFYRPDKEDPSLLQQLFPEYTITGKDGESEQPLDCPARVHVQKEPSLWVNAIVANLSGWHCDIRKMDDVVTDENSNSVDARGPEGKLKMKIDGTDNLVDEWGFTDSVGTRYYTDDYYGERVRAASNDAPLRYLCRAAWKLKPEFEGTPLLQIKAEMVHLLFPEKLSFKSLRQKLSKNQIMFRCFPAGSPVLMADWSEKNIEHIRPGDKVMGFDHGLRSSIVSAIHEREGKAIIAQTDARRVITTTEEHEFLRPIQGKERDFGILKVGSKVVSVYDPSNPSAMLGGYVDPCISDQRDWDWLGGLIDGEGSCGSQVCIYQSESNTEVCQEIRRVLKGLRLPFSEQKDTRRNVLQFKISGGRTTKIRFLRHARMARKKRFRDSLVSSRYIAESPGRRGGSSTQEIIAINSLPLHVCLFDLTTETSNYICQGFAVHNCQQLNEPAADQEAITFDEDSLRSHLAAKIPEDGKKFVAWDTSYAKTNSADYSAGVCGMVTTVDNESTLYILDIIFGKWKPSELAQHMIQFDLKHNPETTLIEEISDAEFLKRELQRLSNLRQSRLNIIWKKASTAADAKRNRIKSLETLLNNDQLWFKNGDWIDETFSQFLRYTGERKNKGRKDDIPDAVAYLQFFVPSSFDNQELREAQEMRERKARQQAMYDRYFTPPEVPVPVYKESSLKRKLFGSLANA